MPSSNFANYGNGWTDGSVYRDICGKCGARRIDRQLGLEATPEAYLATMVQVFREVRRVLRDDGTCWVNMGDSYASSGTRTTGRNDADTIRAIDANSGRRINAMEYGDNDRGGRQYVDSDAGLAPKQLLMMPARLALALQSHRSGDICGRLLHRNIAAAAAAVSAGHPTGAGADPAAGAAAPTAADGTLRRAAMTDTARPKRIRVFERLPLPKDPDEKRREINARRRARRLIMEGYRLMGLSPSEVRQRLGALP